MGVFWGPTWSSLPDQTGNSGKFLTTNGTNPSWATNGGGTVTSVSVTTANGVSGSVATATTTPAITLTLGAITPSSVTSPTLTGGSGTTQSLTYKTTTGVGTTNADHIFLVGNNGATEAMRILNSGFVGIGTNAPGRKLQITATVSAANTDLFSLQNNATAAGTAASLLFTLSTTSSTQSAAICATRTNTGGGGATNLAFSVFNGTALTEGLRITEGAGLQVPSTITTPGTTGNQTINKTSGRVNIAAAGTTVTVTNSLVTANSTVLAVAATADATARVTSVVPAAGSFVINTAACTAETAFMFFVLS